MDEHRKMIKQVAFESRDTEAVIEGDRGGKPLIARNQAHFNPKMIQNGFFLNESDWMERCLGG
jgi:hypothetical protein